MTDLSNQSQFETDSRVAKTGALPEAPLAMPVQPLEAPQASPLAALLSLLRPARATKAGH
ncbi:MAG: hypothetical protein RIR62_1099 [Pseudomonadota bacterium]|jgi:hypothetical protein